MNLPEFLCSIEQVVEGSPKGRKRIVVMRKNIAVIASVRSESDSVKSLAGVPLT
jgi:hypothetical protein